MSSYHASGPCHRCGRAGHLARECSLHICFRCNGRGHMAWECVEGVTCSRCGEKGHLQRNCKNVSCHKCGRRGHISKFCNDPFVKAEEVERRERQQALSKARAASGQGVQKVAFASLSRPATTAAGTQRATRGPWDGLGDSGRDKTFSEPDTSRGLAIGKLGKDRSRLALGNVKILSVKRKIYPEANMERVKRLAQQSCGDLDADTGEEFTGSSTCNNSLKAEEPAQWNGLLGYGSEDSRDDSSPFDNVDSEQQNCSFEEPVQIKLRTSVDRDNFDSSFKSDKDQGILMDTNGDECHQIVEELLQPENIAESLQ